MIKDKKISEKRLIVDEILKATEKVREKHLSDELAKNQALRQKFVKDELVIAGADDSPAKSPEVAQARACASS